MLKALVNPFKRWRQINTRRKKPVQHIGLISAVVPAQLLMPVRAATGAVLPRQSAGEQRRETEPVSAAPGTPEMGSSALVSTGPVSHITQRKSTGESFPAGGWSFFHSDPEVQLADSISPMPKASLPATWLVLLGKPHTCSSKEQSYQTTSTSSKDNPNFSSLKHTHSSDHHKARLLDTIPYLSRFGFRNAAGRALAFTKTTEDLD